ncbi:MAG: hypothetical protein ACLT46_08715 [Hungatella sp.]
MTEFQRLGLAMDKSEEAISGLTKESTSSRTGRTFAEVIEQRQNQWELEKRLELLVLTTDGSLTTYSGRKQANIS